MVREEPLMQISTDAAFAAAQNRVHLAGCTGVLFVDHPHRDAVLIVVHSRHRMKLIVDRQILHDRKVEVHGLRLGAGHYFAVFDFQPRVCVVAVIPCQNRGIILAVAPPVQVDTNGAV